MSSRYLTDTEKRVLQTRFERIARWTFAISFLAFAVGILIGLSGRDAATAVCILAGGYLVNAIVHLIARGTRSGREVADD